MLSPSQAIHMHITVKNSGHSPLCVAASCEFPEVNQMTGGSRCSAEACLSWPFARNCSKSEGAMYHTCGGAAGT